MDRNNHKISSQPGVGYFTPERLAVLKKVFDSACIEFNVSSGPAQEDLAYTIVQAGKTTDDENTLRVIANKFLGGTGK